MRDCDVVVETNKTIVKVVKKKDNFLNAAHSISITMRVVTIFF
jgi:hypothetical protein